MAQIATIKRWQTATAGENLFLYVYDFLSPTMPAFDNDKSLLYSALGLSEFIRLTATMEVVHRCLNATIPLVTLNRDISAARLADELKSVLQVRMPAISIQKLSELSRLSALAYVRRKLPEGLANSIHKESKPQCCWCGKPTSRLKSANKADQATVEHLWPEFLGGESVEDNLIVACGACNGARRHAYTWAWFGVQSCNEKLDAHNSLPKEIKLSVGLHRLMKVASGQTRYSNEVITLKDAAIRLQGIIPETALVPDTRYTFLEILDNAKE